METFSDAAKSLSGSPLGIIALFIVLLYAFASLVTAFSGSFSAGERAPLIYFLITFPFVVLGVFAWLVSQHHTKLYAPRDFKNEEHYVQTATLLLAAQAKSDPTNMRTSISVGAAIKTVESTASQVGRPSQSRKQLLWVDDKPNNNVLERRAFESAGFEVTLAQSTLEAIQKIERGSYVGVISDMGRLEDGKDVQDAGYRLLERMRASGNKTPFFIYSSSSSAQHRKQALDAGAQGATNDPLELYRVVTAANAS